MSAKRCRICLCLKPRRDITELEITEGSTRHSYTEIILFCLDVKVDEDSTLGTKLCVKCHRKILDFYDFKIMARTNNIIKNDIDEHTSESEIFLSKDMIKQEIGNDESHKKESLDDVKIEVTNEKDNDDQDEGLTDDVQDEGLPNDVQDEGLPDDVYNDDSTDEDSDSKEPSIYELSLAERLKKGKNIEEIDEAPENNALLKPKLSRRRRSGFCKECGHVVSDFKAHMSMHLPEDIWQKTTKGQGLAGTCKICGKTVKRLKRHMVVHLPEFHKKVKEAEKQFKGPVNCLICNREFISQQYLDLHMKLHLGHKRQCPFCDKKVSKLRSHIRMMHERDKMKFECDYCGSRHLTRYILRQHIATHTGDKPFRCEDCGKRFIAKGTLITHQRQMHQGLGYLCQYCSKSVASIASLRVHVRSVHTKEKPFSCHDCGKCFSTKQGVKSHVAGFHTHVKNHLCPYCPKKYKTLGQLARHHKEVHLQIKNFKCQFCESRFYRNSHLRRHEYTIHLRYDSDKTDN